MGLLWGLWGFGGMELRLALVERIRWVDELWEVGVYDWGFSAQFFSLLRRG